MMRPGVGPGPADRWPDGPEPARGEAAQLQSDIQTLMGLHPERFVIAVVLVLAVVSVFFAVLGRGCWARRPT